MFESIDDLRMRPVTWETMLKAQKIFHGQVLTEVLREMELADRERQTIEDQRSIYRNRNRFLTLAVALLLGLVITYTLTNRGIPWMGLSLPKWAFGLSPYSFVITVLLDSSLAAYAYIKRY